MPAPRYRAKRKSYVHDRLVEKGDEFNFEGVPSMHWEPLNEPAKEQAKLIKDSKYKRMMDKRLGGKPQAPAAADEAPAGSENPELSEAQQQANIATALGKLDHSNDEHWTKQGEPRIDVVSEFAGFDVSRVMIKTVAPDFVRAAA